MSKTFACGERAGDALSKLSPSEIYAAAATIVLLLLAIVNNAWLMLGASIVGLAAGLILALRPAPEGRQAMLGSLRRAGVFALIGFAVVLVFAIIVLMRG
jgi:hypothetical protein